MLAAPRRQGSSAAALAAAELCGTLVNPCIASSSRLGMLAVPCKQRSSATALSAAGSVESRLRRHAARDQMREETGEQLRIVSVWSVRR